MGNNHTIRLATPADSGHILKIYAPYVRNTAISFETEVPTAREFAARVERISAQYPFLVYEIDGKIAGYAYASAYRERAAYRYSVEVSAYVAPAWQGAGVAYRLYCCLFTLLKDLGYRTAYAGCTVPNEKSVNFHKKFGFMPVGTYHNAGYKLGCWHDVAWLEKDIGAHVREPAEPRPVSSLAAETLREVFAFCAKA